MSATKGFLLHPHAERQFIVGGGDRDLEPAAHVVAALQAMNDRLGMKYLPGPDQFCVTVRWHENDPRRRAVQEQDGAGMLTGANEDGHTTLTRQDETDVACLIPIGVRQDEIPAYVAQRLRNHNLAQIRDVALYTTVHNEQQSVVNAEPWKNRALDKLELLVGNRATPTVHMSDTEARTTRVSDEASRPLERMS